MVSSLKSRVCSQLSSTGFLCWCEVNGSVRPCPQGILSQYNMTGFILKPRSISKKMLIASSVNKFYFVRVKLFEPFNSIRRPVSSFIWKSKLSSYSWKTINNQKLSTVLLWSCVFLDSPQTEPASGMPNKEQVISFVLFLLENITGICLQQKCFIKRSSLSKSSVSRWNLIELKRLIFFVVAFEHP